MAGRRPKPTRLKLITGRQRAARARTGEPEPPTGAIERPAFLKYRAAELWDERAPIYIAMGTLTVADVDNFAVWCVLMAEFDKSQEKMQASLIAQMRLLGAEFGMGASARAKLGTSGNKKPTDPADEFFGGKKTG